MAKTILEMRNITKTFPGVKALDNVNLQVEEGEIHALVGENGAGKYTLMNVLSGIYWTIVNKKDTIFKYIFWERLDSLPIPECCFHFIWC